MSWPRTKLAAVAAITRATIQPEQIPGAAHYIGLENIERGGTISGVMTAAESDVASAKFKFTESQVLFGKLRPYLAKIARPTFSGVCSTDILPISPGPELDRDFLAHFLAYPPTVELAAARSTGANLPRLAPSELASFEIPLPPLTEQKRIAEVLDSVDVLRAKRRHAIALLDDLARAVFHDMFEQQQWDVCDLGSVADISSGITKGRRTDASTRPLPYLAVANVQLMHLNLTEVKIIDATEDEIERYRLLRNDLLLTEGGDPDKLGRGTLWRDEISECIHQNHIFRVRITKPSVIAPVFLNWFVASERGRTYFLKSAKQTTGIASINATQLRNFPLAMPPLHLQQQFAERVEAIEAEKAKHRAHLAKLNELFNSVQSRAFAGTLFG